MLETILIGVVLVVILGVLLWGTGYMLMHGSALDWCLWGPSLGRAIGAIFMLLIEVVSGSMD
jgi:hypothetical protein